MKYIINLIIAVTLIFSLFSIKALAHQNGCHRWHSCESDTGNYVCGDLGYDTYCNGGTTYYEEPDYQSEGHDKGLDHASNDSATIVEAAQNDGGKDGYEHGVANSHESNYPNASLVCDKTFTFQEYSPGEYKDAYQDAYRESCTAKYNDAYKMSYTSGYSQGQAKYNEDRNQELENEIVSNASNTSSGENWFWGIFLGGAVLYGVSALNNKRKNRP
jgi:hypothetical protein